MKKFLAGSIKGKSGEYKINSGSYVVYQDEKSGSFTIDIGTLTGIGLTFPRAMQDLTEQIKEDENDECEICIFNKYGNCVAQGDITTTGDCPSFKD